MLPASRSVTGRRCGCSSSRPRAVRTYRVRPFACAGLRGGGEEGEEWAGPPAGSTNSPRSTTSTRPPSTWWRRGGPNGELLVGAALTQRPERYAALVCMSPSWAWSATSCPGWAPAGCPSTAAPGTPAGWDPARVLPYHRITPATAYPAVLLTASDGDTRTDPLHARKMPAAQQHACPVPAPGRSCCGRNTAWATVAGGPPRGRWRSRPSAWPSSRRR
ncbi:prolyl oligopeptidase family serine peptidase [Streptomyces sp. NRRL WC-3549]|uniref:prolyl oligopeptidase family serine peptidase n=1 Tax=Streptomyces sp. NRRL WC-3549 TaxID=1463925 RepID=UPI003B63DF96